MERWINSAGSYHSYQLTVDAEDSVLQCIQPVPKYGSSSLHNHANQRPYHDIISPHLFSYSLKNFEYYQQLFLRNNQNVAIIIIEGVLRTC